MSSNEARLQKLKVAELKELLAKHHLVQTGKKDDLVKRLLDNGIEVDDEGQEVANGSAPAAPAPAAAEIPASEPAAAATATNESAAPSQPSESTLVAADSLTPEQQAMKARAERFGIPFNPNPTPRAKPTPTPAAAASASSSAPAAASAPKEKEKAGPISGSAASLGISEDVLAKRAAKFGIDKDRAKATAPAEKSAPAVAPAPKSEELTPEMKEKLAIEEEKKRKRAEKFGTGKLAETNGTTEPDAKKTKA